MNNKTDFKTFVIDKFNDWEKSLNGQKDSSLHKYRKSSINNLNELSFPTIKDEEWKYTNINLILNHDFELPSNSGECKYSIAPFEFNNLDAYKLVFLNGSLCSEISDISDLPSKIKVNLFSNLDEDTLKKLSNNKSTFFESVNNVLLKDAVIVSVDKNFILEKPLHIIYLSDIEEKPLLINPRIIFNVGVNSQIDIVQHFSAPANSIYLNNIVTEFNLDDNAVVDHIIVQEESLNSFHFHKMDVHQNGTSSFTSHLVSLGGRLSRNDFVSHLEAEGCTNTLNGLYMVKGTQLFDAHTTIDHAMPNCNSYEHYKGILEDTGKGVFNGKVIVRQDAQKTNAFQENNNVLLSDEATINTKPQLEIFANDVKCSHGATIGQLDADALFYLKARAIGDEAAKTILLHAFASDVVKSIKIQNIKNYIESILDAKFIPDNKVESGN